MMKRRARRVFRPTVDPLDARRLLSGLTPALINSAYGLNAITFALNGRTAKGDGSGQKIAIVDAYHDPYLASDLAVFDSTYRLPAAAVTQVNLAGPATDSGWAGEETLDAEWAHAIAPGAGIVVVEARSDTIDDLIAAVKVARTIPGVSAISMSWGGAEFQGQAAYDSVFTTPTGHTGITFLAASGDEGVGGGAEWPASSPNVVSVGGTTLQTGSAGAYVSESVWSGSSGGSSRYVAEPTYQRGVQSSGSRGTPDVSFVANPDTGVMVYTTDPSNGRGSWGQYGGTSLGAPAWAAILSIVDQGRNLAGKGTLDGASQTLPALYGLPSSDFHAVASDPVTVGNNFRRRVSQQAVASPGRGSPNGAALVNGLVAYGGATAARPRSVVAPSTSTRGLFFTRTAGTLSGLFGGLGRPSSQGSRPRN
ncbi:MAG: S53 family peptidase [Planctomycetia bacterium]|nr:S53 family peptidase [Planctomycetia bacterium]